MVPIQMVVKVKDKQGVIRTKILYQNFLVNSAFAVRPLHFWKVKETREKTQLEAQRLRSEVNNLVPINITPNISVRIHAIFSLMDSKVVTGKIMKFTYLFHMFRFQSFSLLYRHLGLCISKMPHLWINRSWIYLLRCYFWTRPRSPWNDLPKHFTLWAQNLWFFTQNWLSSTLSGKLTKDWIYQQHL